MKELVTIKEVKAANETRTTKALRKMIKSMDELNQGKISKVEFEGARDTIECKRCERGLHNKTDDGLCDNCRKEIEQENKEKERIRLEKENFKALLANLKKLDKNYKLEESKNCNQLFITLTKGDDHCKIYREEIYSGSTWHSRMTGHALRINTSDYDIKANKIKRDFSATNLSTHLHKKCMELLKRITDKRERKLDKEQKEGNLYDAIITAFPGVGDIEKVYRYLQHGSYRNHTMETGNVKFKIDRVWVTTRDAKKFTVASIPKELNAGQVKKLVKFIKEL